VVSLDYIEVQADRAFSEPEELLKLWRQCGQRGHHYLVTEYVPNTGWCSFCIHCLVTFSQDDGHATDAPPIPERTPPQFWGVPAEPAAIAAGSTKYKVQSTKY
jgi:hypothetical protein